MKTFSPELQWKLSLLSYSKKLNNIVEFFLGWKVRYFIMAVFRGSIQWSKNKKKKKKKRKGTVLTVCLSSELVLLRMLSESRATVHNHRPLSDWEHEPLIERTCKIIIDKGGNQTNMTLYSMGQPQADIGFLGMFVGGGGGVRFFFTGTKAARVIFNNNPLSTRWHKRGKHEISFSLPGVRDGDCRRPELFKQVKI